MMNSIAVSFIGYTLIIFGFGIYTARYLKHSSADYFLAGRSLGAWLAALSTTASAESGWVTLGLVGTAFNTGVGAFWIVPGTVTAFLFNWYFIANRLRFNSQQNGNITLTDVLASNTTATPARLIRYLSTLIILLMLCTYIAAQLTVAAKSFETVFGWSYLNGVLLGAGMVLIYTMLGGFRAVALTDMLQALLMLSAVVILPLVLINKIGGFDTLWSNLQSMETDGQLTSPFAGKTGMALLGFFALWMGIPLGNVGQPHILIRFMATRDRTAIRQGAIISRAWVMVLFTGAVLLGIAARAYYGTLADPEKALPIAAVDLLPGWLAGMMVAAILAAVCSTADSQLLVCASSISHDWWYRIKGRTQHGKSLLLTHRLTVLGIGLVATLITLTESRVILRFVLYAWAGLGAAFGPVLILTLLWRRTTSWGVLAGILTGFVMVIVWNEIPLLKASAYELGPAFASSFLMTVLVSLCTVEKPSHN